MFFNTTPEIIDGRKYIVLECLFRRGWDVISESDKGVTKGQALEIVHYWKKYKGVDDNQIMVIEVPDIVRPR